MATNWTEMGSVNWDPNDFELFLRQLDGPPEHPPPLQWPATASFPDHRPIRAVKRRKLTQAQATQAIYPVLQQQANLGAQSWSSQYQSTWTTQTHVQSEIHRVVHHQWTIPAAQPQPPPHPEVYQQARPTSLTGPTTAQSPIQNSEIITEEKILSLMHKINPTLSLGNGIVELFQTLTNNFIESTVAGACLVAKHRQGRTLQTMDVELHLKRGLNMPIPSSGNRKMTNAHKERLKLIAKRR